MNSDDLRSIVLILFGAIIISVWMTVTKTKHVFREFWDYAAPQSFYEGAR